MTTIKTSLNGYGPISATGTVQINPDQHEQGEPKYIVLNLTVKNALGIEITTDLDDDEQATIEDQLIEDFQDEAGRYQDYLTDVAIETHRERHSFTYA